MAATGNSCFWLPDLKKSFPPKPLGQMNQNLVGSIYGKSSMGDFQKNEDFSFSENNLNIKWYERKVNILRHAQW
jgi:hypothetical protein